MRFFRHVVVLHGNAVGGGSITYAQTLWQPKDDVWQHGEWAGLADWQRLMPSHYATAKKMLGAATNQRVAHADKQLYKMAQAAGVADTFYHTEVGVFFGDADKPQGMSYPDPYFDGRGPERNSCIGCGGCMLGCRYNAKNTLDKNYLYLAEQLGVQVFPNTEVLDVEPLNGADGREGYRIQTSMQKKITAQSVIFSAGSLGTQALLFKMKQAGKLPNISHQLGHNVRTNAESLIAVRYTDDGMDYSKGIAIGSGVFIDEHTHIEATRYPKGSDALGFLLTMLVRGATHGERFRRWFGVLIRHPIQFFKMMWPIGFAQQTLILLCMQSTDGHLTMRYERPWYWPFSKRLRTSGDKIPTYIDSANEFALRGAKATGGTAAMSVTEVLLDIPMTAHCIGGAVMGATADEGVCDAQMQVFGYDNMWICDGSVVSANLGVNPSLTITALAEYAMSLIPARDDASEFKRES